MRPGPPNDTSLAPSRSQRLSRNIATDQHGAAPSGSGTGPAGFRSISFPLLSFPLPRPGACVCVLSLLSTPLRAGPFLSNSCPPRGVVEGAKLAVLVPTPNKGSVFIRHAQAVDLASRRHWTSRSKVGYWRLDNRNGVVSARRLSYSPRGNCFPPSLLHVIRLREAARLLGPLLHHAQHRHVRWPWPGQAARH